YAKVATQLTGPMHLGHVFLFGKKRHDLTVDIISGPKHVDMKFRPGGVKKPKIYPSLNFLNVAYGGRRYLFIVNAAEKPVKAIIGGLPYGNIDVHPLLTNAKDFRVAEGSFPITLPPLGVKAFQFSRGRSE